MSTSDEVVGRAERLPLTALHHRIMVMLGFGTFLSR